LQRAWAPENLRRYRRNSSPASLGRKSSDYIIQLVPASNAEVSIYKRKNRPFEVPQLVKEVQTVSSYNISTLSSYQLLDFLYRTRTATSSS
jgi:hypothetical protein